MVDKNMVLRKLSAIDDYLQQIREFSGVSLDEYKSDWKSQRIVERTLQMLIETCADIANHIISDRNMRIPTSYSDTFRVLLENNVIDENLFGVMESPCTHNTGVCKAGRLNQPDTFHIIL